VRYFQTVKEALRFAISIEEDSSLFYTSLMQKTPSKSLQAVVKEFIRHEQEHVKTLENLVETCSSEKIAKALSLKISNYTPPMGVVGLAKIAYKDMLAIAVRKENACFKLYRDLARSSSDAEVREIFSAMANQEAHHRLAFQREYNEMSNIN